MDWKSMTIPDFLRMFDEIYAPTKNLERSFHQMLALFLESIARISQYTIKQDHSNLLKYLPKVFAWYCGLVNMSGLKGEDVDNALD